MLVENTPELQAQATTLRAEIAAELTKASPDWSAIVDMVANLVKLFLPAQYHAIVDLIADVIKRFLAILLP